MCACSYRSACPCFYQRSCRRCSCRPARPFIGMGDLICELIGWTVGLVIMFGAGAMLLASF